MVLALQLPSQARTRVHPEVARPESNLLALRAFHAVVHDDERQKRRDRRASAKRSRGTSVRPTPSLPDEATSRQGAPEGTIAEAIDPPPTPPEEEPPEETYSLERERALPSVSSRNRRARKRDAGTLPRTAKRRLPGGEKCCGQSP